MNSFSSMGADQGLPDVAPYRILKRIGSGGMGEVFLAEDDRLGRQVAIKRIRPDRDLGAAARERLRREARYAAGLSHPAIVQVHDVVEREEILYVVMEWVDGEDLRRRLKLGGPLPAERVVRLGRHLAAGLAAAHRRGIVHRDFKSENVLIDGEGQVKIADFGIATRLAGGGERLEEALTRPDTVLGTYRILSPEQVLGEEVDQRSDLFSFGILLYEALAGRSPFGESDSLATLRRIVEEEPLPIDTLEPTLPPPLVDLIGRLLAKDPNLRPRSAGEVERELAELEEGEGTLSSSRQLLRETPTTPITGSRQPPAGAGIGHKRGLAAGLLALVAVAAVSWWWVSRTPPTGPLPRALMPPIYAVVTAPELHLETEAVGTSATTPEIFSEAVRVAVVRGLIGLDAVSAKAPQMTAGGGDPFQVARSIAADEIMTSSILWRGEIGRVTMSRLRVTDAVVLWNDSLDVPSDDLVLVMRAISGLTRRAYPDHAVRPSFPGIDVEPRDLRRFLELRRRFLEREDPSGEHTLTELENLRRASPHFVDIDLLIIDAALHRFYDSRDPEHLRLAEAALARARRLAPQDPRVLRRRVYIEIEAARPEAAEVALDRLQQALPGDVGVDDLRARLWHKQGRSLEAAKLLRRVTELYPATRRLVRLARLEIDLGQIADARRHLRLAGDRSVDDFEALSLLAQLELTVGDPEAAVELYQQLVSRSAGSSELSNLGLALMLLGRHGPAAEHFERALEAEPRNPFFALNLADALWLSGDRERAMEHYLGVVERMGEETAAGRSQFLTVEAQALAHLGRGREAVSLLQRALNQAPDSASVAYEASLVYALVGETTSALVQAQAALERGFEARWFEFPWFDVLRRHEEFRAVLKSAAAEADRSAESRDELSPEDHRDC